LFKKNELRLYEGESGGVNSGEKTGGKQKGIALKEAERAAGWYWN